MNNEKVEFLEGKAKELRMNLLEMIYMAGAGHPGGSLSASDIVTTLYYDELNIDPKNPHWYERDRLVLSKGHCCPVIYTVLAMKGYYDMEVIKTLRKLGSILQGHPDMHKVPGIDMSTGSLGQGLSAAIGMAIAAKQDKLNSRVYAILGDGECDEGQVWEAAMSASKYKLDNLVAIVDRNHLQNDGCVCDIMPTNNLADMWRATGFEVFEINGHNIEEILEAFAKARKVSGKPVCIVADTVKGKGVSFMENVVAWHGMAPNKEQYEKAISEIKEA
ncbi:transketolase [Clostridium sp.]|uniref:transketolase n=1 Tax=Clostridium sp. TaxID=1506 RepID=UPI003D6D68AA